MEEFLQNCYDQHCHLGDKQQIASSMLAQLRLDMANICPNQDCKDALENLGKALDHYFKKKEYKYTIILLDHYLATGNFDVNVEGFPDNFQSDRYIRIEDFLKEKFDVSEVPVTFNVSEEWKG